MNFSIQHLHSWWRVCWQILVIGAIWLLGTAIVSVTHLPLSAGVVGMLMMLLLLASGLVKVTQVSDGAQLLLGELLFFFMPILIAVVQYKALFIAEGWQLVVSIMLGTMLVMFSTALTLKYCYRLRRSWIKRRHS